VASVPTVELIFDATRPNVDAARRQVRDALVRIGRVPQGIEWDRATAGAPADVQRYASPTVLVAGRDITGGGTIDAGAGCRVYRDSAGEFVGAPTVDAIVAALTAAEGV
jgi:hypothetical protein